MVPLFALCANQQAKLGSDQSKGPTPARTQSPGARNANAGNGPSVGSGAAKSSAGSGGFSGGAKTGELICLNSSTKTSLSKSIRQSLGEEVRVVHLPCLKGPVFCSVALYVA